MLGLLIGVIAAANIPDAPAQLRGVKTIVTLGDSITQGGGQPGGYVWLLQKYLSVLYPQQAIHVVNAGISGHKSTDMAARFQRDVIAARPDIVTISVGVNDVWHAFYDFTAGKPILEGNGPNGVPIVTYRNKVDEMIRAARSAGIRPILLSATMVYENFSGPENARIVEYNRSLQALARQHGISYIDLFGVFRKTILEYQKHAGTRVNLVTSDGVHLNPAGNQLMAYTILKALGVSDNSLADARASVDSSLKTERP